MAKQEQIVVHHGKTKINCGLGALKTYMQHQVETPNGRWEKTKERSRQQGKPPAEIASKAAQNHQRTGRTPEDATSTVPQRLALLIGRIVHFYVNVLY